MKNNKRGFTLIEIVMVLVLLGILAAVAVPKYYDLKETAESRAADAVVAEYQARMNAKFAEQLMTKKADGSLTSCGEARLAGIREADKLATEVTDYTITPLASDTSSADSFKNKGQVDLTISFKSGKTEKYKVTIPSCSGDS